jgi:hypothetical protein
MAKIYKIENKRYEFKEIDSATASSYLLTEQDHNKWIKLKTEDNSIDLQLPANLSNGFRCVIENTGVFTVNYINAVGTSVATQQDKFTEDQYRTIEAVYDNNVWRLQGYIGRQDLNSLYDVNVNVNGLPSDGDALIYDINSNVWKAGKNVPFTPSDPIFSNHIITDLDHGQILLFDTTASPITVSFNLGLEDGLHVRVINIGTGTLTIASAGTFNAAGSTLAQWQGMDILHAASDVFYGVIFDGIGSTGGSGGGGGYAAGNYFETFIATSYTGIFPTTHETNSNSLVIGTQTRSFQDNQVVIGSIATADGVNDIAIGHQADCDGVGEGKIAIGRLSSADAVNAISIGTSSSALSSNSIALGSNSNASSPSSIQLGAGINNETQTLNFLNAKVAHNFGVNIRTEDAENTVTTIQRFAETFENGGVAQHPTLASIAMSFPNRQLYIGTGTVDFPSDPHKQWIPINTPPNLDFLKGDYSDNLNRVTSGCHYYQNGIIQRLWAAVPNGYTDNLNKEQWTSLQWLDSNELGSNSGNIVYYRHYQNEPFFRQNQGSGDIKFSRWVVQTNVNGLSNLNNGPFSIPASDLSSFSSLLEEGDRVLFVNQTDTSENGIYRFDTFDGSFYIFNRPQDLQLGNLLGTETIQIWGDNTGEGYWIPNSNVNVGTSITFNYTSNIINVLEGALYFTTKAIGNYLINLRLKPVPQTTPSNPNARAVLTLRRVDTTLNNDSIYDQFSFNLYSKDSNGNDILNDIRLSQIIELPRSRFYFTLAFYDTPEVVLYTNNSNNNYDTSTIKISPVQLFEVAH